MLGRLFNPLMRRVWNGLEAALKRQFGKFLKRVEGLTSANVDELAAAIADSKTYQAAGIAKQSTRDRITNERSKEKVEFDAIPLEVLETSPVLATALSERLAANVAIRASATELQMTPTQTSDVLKQYSIQLVRYGVRGALEKLQKAETQLYAGYVVLGIEENEPYDISGVAKTRNMVRFVHSRDLDKARRFWRRRKRAEFRFERNVFNQ